MTAAQFRKLALKLNGATEGAHMGHPDFRANGRIFATLHPGDKTGMVKLSPEEQVEFMNGDPAAFSPASGAWGRQGCTIVQLAVVETDKLGEAMTLAWQGAMKAGKPKTKRSAKAKSR
jgi:hypothetical protein